MAVDDDEHDSVMRVLWETCVDKSVNGLMKRMDQTNSSIVQMLVFASKYKEFTRVETCYIVFNQDRNL